MPEVNTFIKCGDTDWCGECIAAEKTANGSGIRIPVHTLNELGRCDCYDGPDNKRVRVSRS